MRLWAKYMGSQIGDAWFEKKINPDNSVLLFSDASNLVAAAVLGNKCTILTFEDKFEWMARKSIA